VLRKFFWIAMRMGRECAECLRGLARLTIELSSQDIKLREALMRKADEIIASYPQDAVPSDISNEFFRVIYEMSGNRDPFRERKREEMRRAKELAGRLGEPSDPDECVEFAAMGNSLDFFLPVSSLEKAVREKPRFAIDHRKELWRRLDGAKEVLYIADNAGEVFFDIPLLRFLSRRAKVFYAVKERPVQNDLSLEDVEGLQIPAEIIPAPPTVGVYLSLAGEAFKRKFYSADIIISKGMGNYETLSEFNFGGRCFYILRAKCQPVAESLGVEKGDYVAAFEAPPE